MLKAGLTTFAESPDPTRSDCHAWSASPLYDFLSTLCGITPASAGFKTVNIRPEPGGLKWIKGTMPSPHGEIVVSVEKKGTVHAEISVGLPAGVTGTLIWQTSRKLLHSGENRFSL
jgi:hypothetical protein